MAIPVDRNPNPKPHVREEDLGFGKVFTDHMFLAEWDEGKGWHDARVVPYGPIALYPAASCLHYGQEAFEGMKAFAGQGGMVLFRPRAHIARLARTRSRNFRTEDHAPLGARLCPATTLFITRARR